MLFERLEPRKLMSVSLNPNTHVLTILGTPNNDNIFLNVTNQTLQVNDNGSVKAFPVASVKQIYADAKAGDDVIQLDASVSITSRLYSGPGGFSASQGDIINGGSGLDKIYMDSDLGDVSGGGGPDFITVSGGACSIFGDGGNDTITTAVAGGSHDNRYDGGTGNDTVDYSSSTVGVVLRNGVSGRYFPGTTTVDGSQQDLISGMENFTGGAGNDYIFGDFANNILSGKGGNDFLDGKGGNDFLDGGAGSDALFGGDNNDILKAKDNEKDYLEGGNGSDSASLDVIKDTTNGTIEHVTN